MKRVNNLGKYLSRFLIIGLVVALVFIKYGQYQAVKREDYKPALTEGGAAALCYHYVREGNLWNVAVEKLTNARELTKYAVYEDEFKRQIDFLIEQGAYFATLEEIVEFNKTGEYPDKCVWISFDDGEESVYKEVYPYLKEKQIPFTMFIIAGQVGSDDFDNLKLSDWDELREMRDSGLVSFGAHTYDMHYLRGDKAIFLYEDQYEDFYKDIKRCKMSLEKHLGVEITTLAYPFGNASDEVTALVEKAGYEAAFILAPYPTDSRNYAYLQNRYLPDKNNFDGIFSKWTENAN